MKNILTLIVLGVAVGILALAGFTLIQNKQKSQNQMMETTKQSRVMESLPAQQGEQVMEESSYVDYSPTAYAQAIGKKRVLFFHASWCPTCKEANTDFTSNSSNIPDGVVVFKTDYDTQQDLKEKYGITYQHTFVQVDDQGAEVTKWNGGGR